MKKQFTTLFLTAVCILGIASACRVHVHHHGRKKLPPGQAKKVYGTQSAKPFAPGQQGKDEPSGKNKKDKN